MKKILLSILIVFAICVASQAQDQILGKYWSPKKDGKTIIYKQGNKYYGKLYWVQDPKWKDDKNPDPKLRNRPLVDAVFMYDFVYDGKGSWEKGKIYDFESGKTYDCIITFKENKLDLNVRGYIGFSLLGRTEVFEKVKGN